MIQHRGILLPEDVVERHGVPVVSAERLVMELAMVTDLEHALTFTNELLHLRHTTVDQLWIRYDLARHWPAQSQRRGVASTLHALV